MTALLEVEDLDVHYGRPGAPGSVKAVDGVSLSVERGRTLGLVGESGCGKSTTGYAILQLVRPSGGRVLFKGTDLCTLSKPNLRRMRRKLQIIFQDAHASLNPRMPIGDLVGEALDIHGLYPGAARSKRIRALLDMVGMGAHLVERYPHELSGGQAQRIAICRALAVEPELIVCDEPVSALDVSIQAQIVNLLQDLKAEFGLTYLFISHDLAVIRHVSDRVAVMYRGKLVETAPAGALYTTPRHPYTQLLLRSVPLPDPRAEAERRRAAALLQPPQRDAVEGGCPFAPRCPTAQFPLCTTTAPGLVEVASGHSTACHLA